MKTIKLKKTGVSTSQEDFKDFELNYRKELLQIVEVSTEGMTISQMQNALKVQKALNSISDEGTLFLEDADHDWLKGRMVANKWRIVAPEIVEFHNAVCDAKETEAPHLKGEKSADRKAAKA